MIVKICGITNREDAEASIEAGASALGFNFWPRSPRYIAPEAAARLLSEVPAHVWKVGVFVNERAGLVAELAGRLHLDVVQIHGEEPPPAGLRVWKAIPMNDRFQVSLLEDDTAEAFLLDAPAGEQHGGTGRNFDWRLVQSTARRIVVAGGLDASNVRQAIAGTHPWGVDACSRLESSPGRKDHRLVKEFIEAALSEGIG